MIQKSDRRGSGWQCVVLYFHSHKCLRKRQQQQRLEQTLTPRGKTAALWEISSAKRQQTRLRSDTDRPDEMQGDPVHVLLEFIFQYIGCTRHIIYIQLHVHRFKCAKLLRQENICPTGYSREEEVLSSFTSDRKSFCLQCTLFLVFLKHEHIKIITREAQGPDSQRIQFLTFSPCFQT